MLAVPTAIAGIYGINRPRFDQSLPE